MHDFALEINDAFKKSSDELIGRGQEAYLKNKFQCHGIKAPERREIQSIYYSRFKSFAPNDKILVIDALWRLPHRECHMCALDLSKYYKEIITLDYIHYWEEKIITNSWWDSVDFIAPHILGKILLKDGDNQRKFAYKWAESENLWLKRSALIFQLKYKKLTNFELLEEMILGLNPSKEFFINKAMGWSLREYGKVNPKWVSNFIHQHKELLSPLTIKEGMRIILSGKDC
jgi:3-methyladenine DNA glycosylase AlkD